jgi:hypothetical protein
VRIRDPGTTNNVQNHTHQLIKRYALFWHYISVELWFPSEISAQRIGPIFNGQALKMGPIGCPETSVRNCRSTLRKIPKERRSHLHRSGSLKSRIKTNDVIRVGGTYLKHRDWRWPMLKRDINTKGFKTMRPLCTQLRDVSYLKKNVDWRSSLGGTLKYIQTARQANAFLCSHLCV